MKQIQARFLKEQRENDDGQVYVAYRLQSHVGDKVFTSEMIKSEILKDKSQVFEWFKRWYDEEVAKGAFLEPLQQ